MAGELLSQEYPFQLPLHPWLQRGKIIWPDASTPAIAIYDSDDNLRLKFSLNFISLMYSRIYLMKIFLNLWQEE